MKLFYKLIKFIHESEKYINVFHYIIIHFKRVQWFQDIKFENNGRDTFSYKNDPKGYFYGTVQERNKMLNDICR